MDYTPRQLHSFAIIADHRRRHEMAAQLSMDHLAAHGDAAAMRKTLKELFDDGR